MVLVLKLAAYWRDVPWRPLVEHVMTALRREEQEYDDERYDERAQADDSDLEQRRSTLADAPSAPALDLWSGRDGLKRRRRLRFCSFVIRAKRCYGRIRGIGLIGCPALIDFFP